MSKTRCNFPLAALPVAVFGAFILSGIAASIVAAQFTHWTEPFVGPCCAVTVIVVTFWLSPVEKRTFGIMVLLLGVLMAWVLLPNYYPEHHPKAYQHTDIPFVITVVAGLVSYLACSYFWPPESSPKNG